MAHKRTDQKRSRVGYGSSYRRGNDRDSSMFPALESVLAGQVWRVRPDKEAGADHPCIWMQAGVVNFKECSNFYDCITCRYDLGMRKRVAEGRQVGWQDAMRMRDGLHRVCRHSLSRRIERRSCAHDYECSRCEFDQFFEDTWALRTGQGPFETSTIRGFDMAADHYYHDGHTWVRIESGGLLRVGMDDFSGKLFGAPDRFDLPVLGKEMRRDRVCWALDRGERRAGVLSPVDGVIVEVNAALWAKPELAKQAPYEEGWMFVLRTPDLKAATQGLMEETEGVDWLTRESERLEQMIEAVAGPLAADGGYFSDDIYGKLPELGWEDLSRIFLKS